MNPDSVQSLVLRAPHGPTVAHRVLQVPPGRGIAALHVLRRQVLTSFGPRPPDAPCQSLGFSFEGLQALGVPEGYLRLFRRLAPAFRDGAVLRSTQLGDSGASAAPNWMPEFQSSWPHVVVTWFGSAYQVRQWHDAFVKEWQDAVGPAGPGSAPGAWPPRLYGRRLGAPPLQTGEWVHYGFRDGLSEVCIDQDEPRPQAPDLRDHKPGALLLGHVDDAGTNPFVLSQAPDKVRRFFHDSSFGILRPMAQDVAAFEQQVQAWAAQLAPLYPVPVSTDFVKSKLGGRWPDGSVPLPGQLAPSDRFVVHPKGEPSDFPGDAMGQGCPFGSHVRRMRAAPDGRGRVFERPLQRRSVPFGSADWGGQSRDGQPRGLLGHFFCASIEDQFEHLLGQWAAGPPLGASRDDQAPDPLTGPHQDASAGLRVPLQDRPVQHLSGFRAWTTTLGTLYAWYPGSDGLQALMDNDFIPDEDDGERPWR